MCQIYMHLKYSIVILVQGLTSKTLKKKNSVLKCCYTLTIYPVSESLVASFQIIMIFVRFYLTQVKHFKGRLALTAYGSYLEGGQTLADYASYLNGSQILADYASYLNEILTLPAYASYLNGSVTLPAYASYLKGSQTLRDYAS